MLMAGSAILTALRETMCVAPAAIVVADVGAAARMQHPEALRCALTQAGLPVAFCGHAPASQRLVAMLDRQVGSEPEPPSPDFRVLAIVPAYNEADIIAQTLADMIAQGLTPYVIDNWSSDGTYARARAFLGRGLAGIERFPSEAPPQTYNLTDILTRVEQIAAASDWADWVMLHDADERRRSPFAQLTLREALWRADRAGFNCIDHVTLNFWPVDDGFDGERARLEDYFAHFEFSDHPGHFHQRRAWKRTGAPVALADSAGHDVRFPGRKVYPYKFLLKHYPVRSQRHGERKVLHERLNRWNADERARGWHRQYEAAPLRFLRDPATLTRFDKRAFRERYLVQSLSGAGIFKAPPPWATPPRW